LTESLGVRSADYRDRERSTQQHSNGSKIRKEFSADASSLLSGSADQLMAADCRRCRRTKGINAMNLTSMGLGLAEEQIFNEELSDEALERAGMDVGGEALTIAMCSGLSSCPSAPA
jgi:hypothetical protein